MRHRSHTSVDPYSHLVNPVGVIKQTENRRMGIQEGGNVGSVNAGGLETGGRHLIAG